MENRSARGDGWVRTASLIFCIISALFALYVLFKYVFALVLPILIGLAVGAAASVLASKLSKYTGASKKAVSFAVLLTLLGALVALLFLGIRRLTDELGRLAQSITSGEGEIFTFFAICATVIKIQHDSGGDDTTVTAIARNPAYRPLSEHCTEPLDAIAAFHRRRANHAGRSAPETYCQSAPESASKNEKSKNAPACFR